ncbi:MAG: ferritin-like domain-containing protein [Polyangiaceae bacterium]|nr:ferritin-like domain-containing protein [Polyangiaceae bacterium]
MNLLDLRADARAVMPHVNVSEPVRARAIATWRGRMINEHGSSRVFDQLARQMALAGFESSLVQQASEFAAEEKHHGVLCGAVVEAFGGEAVAPPRVEHDLPEHEDVSRIEAVMRNVLSISCLSESVAVALIGAERLRMPEGELRALLTRIYSDEVGHSRFGWALVAQHAGSWDAAAKERLGKYLALAFAHLEAHELAHLPVLGPLPEGAEDVGVCDGGEARKLFFATVREVIVPALEGYGLPAERAYQASRRIVLQ